MLHADLRICVWFAKGVFVGEALPWHLYGYVRDAQGQIDLMSPDLPDLAVGSWQDDTVDG